MRLGPTIGIALLAACGAEGGSIAPGDPPPGPPAITSGSLALTLATVPRCQGLDPCTRLPGDVPLWLALLDGGRVLRVSSPAAVAELAVVGGRARLSDQLLVQQEELGQIVLDELELHLADGDGDGVLDAATASASGHFGFLAARCDPAASRGLFTAEESTAGLYEPPGVEVDDAVWPASGIPVRSGGAALRITSAHATVGEDAYDIPAPPDRDVELALAPAPLPFGAAGLLALGIEDLTGSALARTAPFRTVDLSPGALDGSFESGSLAGMAGRDVLVVDRYLVPGSGARIAYTRHGMLTFPVLVPESGGELRFAVQALNQPGRVVVRVVGPGGFTSKSYVLQITEDVTDVPAIFAPGMLQAVSPSLDAVVDLGEQAGSRAVVEIRLEGPALCEVLAEFAGFALDDLSLP